jgi:glycosyltransferase involved in cell wall biosynthesis
VLGLLKGFARISSKVHVRGYVLDVRSARDALGGVDGRCVSLARLVPGLPLLRVVLAPLYARVRDRLDLWHGTFSAPPFADVPTVLACHDALFATRPDLLPRLLALRLRLTLPRALERAARVLAPTEAVKRDLIEAARVDPAKIDVAPFGIDTRLFHPGGDPEVDRRMLASRGVDAGGPYVLYVGRWDRRKGVQGLLRAFAAAEKEVRSGARLVLAGPIHGAGARALLEHATALSVSLVVVTNVPDGALPALYRGARVFVYPSRGEGVGVPVLEALACGAPVVAMRLPAIEEVAGDAPLALLVPGDEDGLAHAIRRALEDDEAVLAARARGPLRVASRTVEAMAEATRQSYLRAAASRKA